METFIAIYRVLRRLEQMMNQEEPDHGWISATALRLTEAKRAGVLEMLTEEGYISGVSIRRTEKGALLESIVTNPRITLPGLTYLKTDPMMLKAAELASGTMEHKQS